MLSEFFADFQLDLSRAFADGVHFWVFLAALVYLWFAEKKWRKPLVYPVTVLIILVCNPWCYYHVWPKVVRYAYSRLLWVVPVVAVIALACVSLVRKAKNLCLQGVLILILALAITRIGPYMYVQNFDDFISPGYYAKAENAYHLVGNVVTISEKLLELDPEPMVVCDTSYSPFMRLVSPKIHLYAGRYGFNVRTKKEKKMLDALVRSEPNYKWIRKRMIKDGYTYLMMLEWHGAPDVVCPYGFELLDQAQDITGSVVYLYRVQE